MRAAQNHRTVPVWADAAYLLVTGAVAFCSMLSAIVMDGRTRGGFLVWVLATASAYAVQYRWQRAQRLRAALRGSILARRWVECLTLAVTVFVTAAILFPVFAHSRRGSNRGPSPSSCLASAFMNLIRDSPDGRMPQIRTQREARERLAPYLEQYVRIYNERRARRKLPPITSDYFWEVGGGSGQSWIFNPQVSGKSSKELLSKSGAPVLVWSAAPRQSYRIPSDVCRPVIRLNDRHGCLNAEEWERVRPRF